MLLPPFRIRDLYGQSRHGVVQITVPQYDSTLKSHPDAALTYLDEDDGETVTVGSGFELGQRLQDPVPHHKAFVASQDLKDQITHDDLHTFDVQKTSYSIATWMDHEAYSSKSLRSLSTSSTSSVPDSSKLANLEKENTLEVAEIDLISEDRQLTELDMYQEMHDKEVQTTLSGSNQQHTSTQESVGGSLNDKSPPSDDVDKMVSETLQNITANIDSHIDTLADFLLNTSEALRLVAEKTRDKDTSAVESILSGFTAIFGEVAKLAQGILEPVNAIELGPTVKPIELDLQQDENTLQKDRAKTERNEGSELSASSEMVADIVDLPSPMVASSPRPIAQVATLPLQESACSPSHHPGAEITARLPTSQLDKLYHIPSKSLADSQPQEISAEKDHMYAALERGDFNPDSDRTWKYMPLPDDDHVAKTRKRVEFALPQGALRPRETAKSSSETFPRSILDLEASDPDFSARFPPLLSDRRSRTMSALRQRSKSPDIRTRSCQDALTRYPSLQQLEKRKAPDFQFRDSREEKQQHIAEREKQPIPHMHRAWFNDLEARASGEYVTDPFKPQSDEIKKIIAAVGHDITEASNEVRRLPGAWPEAQVDVKALHLPTSNESSGAFFNRMTGHGARLEKKQDTPVVDPLSTEWPSFDEHDLRSRQKPKQLERAKSMASFKPSATLTTPFDPLIAPTMASGPVGFDISRLQRSEPRTAAEEHADFEAFFNPGGAKSQTSSTRDEKSSDNTSGMSDPNRPPGSKFVKFLLYEQQGRPRPLSQQEQDLQVADYQKQLMLLEQQNKRRLEEQNKRRHMLARPEDISQSIQQANDDEASPKHDGIRRSVTERMPHRRPYSHRYSGAGRLPWEHFEDGSFDLRTGSHVQRQDRARRSADRPAPPPAVVRQNPSHPIKLPSDLHQRVNDYRSGLRHRASAPTMGIAKQSKINDCIQQLKDMGFGNDATEASRLTVYAGASGGDIFEAVEMIEEDRKAVAAIKSRRQTSGPENGPGGWL